MLPLELFQDIIKQLPDADYMAMKFVCRSFYAATFHPNGSAILDLKARARAKAAEEAKQLAPDDWRFRFWKSSSEYIRQYMSGFRLRYQYVLSNLEGSYSGTLLRLTCVLCGRRKGHGQFGFCDEQFDPALYDRRCLDCRYKSDYGYRHSPSKVKVNGVTVTRCEYCRRICPVARRLTRTGAQVPQHRCGQDLGLLG
jgi:hypothetical protein